MRRLVRSIRQRGLLRTVGYAFQRLWPGFLQSQREREALKARTRDDATREFDLAHGVETGGRVHPERLRLDAATRPHAYFYEAVRPREFHEMMAAAGPVAGRTFVDLGCGKGRAVLLAATHPFARVVGVEAAADLVDRARENVRAYRGEPLPCEHVAIVLGDAAAFEFPDGPLVVFLFNPFDEPTTERVADNLRRSLDRAPRPVTIVHANPRHAAVWERLPFPRRETRGQVSEPDAVGYEGWRIFHLEPGRDRR